MTHDTVGWRFEAYGAVYRCTKYVLSDGYWMRWLEGGDSFAAADRCVSERAIGRTFHRVRDDEPPAPHDFDCECRICRDDV